jgi:hypothetical protein
MKGLFIDDLLIKDMKNILDVTNVVDSSGFLGD